MNSRCNVAVYSYTASLRIEKLSNSDAKTVFTRFARGVQKYALLIIPLLYWWIWMLMNRILVSHHRPNMNIPYTLTETAFHHTHALCAVPTTHRCGNIESKPNRRSQCIHGAYHTHLLQSEIIAWRDRAHTHFSPVPHIYYEIWIIGACHMASYELNAISIMAFGTNMQMLEFMVGNYQSLEVIRRPISMSLLMWAIIDGRCKRMNEQPAALHYVVLWLFWYVLCILNIRNDYNCTENSMNIGVSSNLMMRIRESCKLT